MTKLGPKTLLYTRAILLWALFVLSFAFITTEPVQASPYAFGGGACKTQGTWTENAISAARDLSTVVEGLRNAEGCGQLAHALETYVKSLNDNLRSVEEYQTQTSRMSTVQDEIVASRQYAKHPELGSIASQSMISGINELAALSVGGSVQDNNRSETTTSNSRSSLPDLGSRAFRVGKTGIALTDKILDAMTAEEMKCLSSPNLMGPFFTAMVQLSASLVNSGQDFFGKDVSSLVNKITSLARTVHFDRINRDLNWLNYQNSMSCLIDTLSEGYCSTLDAQVLFNEEMQRAKPISWAWDSGNSSKEWRENKSTPSGNPEALKNSIFEGYYVLTQQLPVVTAFLERIQRGIPPKNYSDANFQNKIQSNTFGYFLNERNIVAEWNEARTTITQMTSLEAQKSAIADTLKKLARLIVTRSDAESSGLNFLDRVTNPRKVIFQLMGREIPPEVIGKNGMQIGPESWLDVNFSHFIGDPGAAMAEISKNLDALLASANQAAVEYYNYWFIADQPGLMIDSLTGMTYNIPEALTGIRDYLVHFSKQDYVDAAVLPAVYETIEKINRILSQFQKLRETGLDLQKKYGDLDQYPIEKRRELLGKAINQYKDLIEIFYNEFIILKARSSFLVNRLTSFVKIDYQKRLRRKNFDPAQDNEVLREIYYATGDLVFERMRLISSKNPAEIDSDLNLAQRTYLQSLRSLEDLVKDSFAAAIAQMKMEVEGVDTTTTGIFEDSIIRANRDSDASTVALWQAWLSDRIYDHLPTFLKPIEKRTWDYRAADKIYGTARMYLNPDRYPGMYALNPVRIFSKREAPGVQENANGAIQKTLSLFCIQSLAFRDQGPFAQICKGVVLKSPIIDDTFRSKNPDFPYLNFLDVSYEQIQNAYLQTIGDAKKNLPQLFPDLNEPIGDAKLRRSKNFDARVCALRQRNRNNYIMYLTQGQYGNRN
ncbi:MAG: hypothetical protein RJB66_382 [Pseudomonadota bacterium]|jgi:hypothetical protein